MARTGTCLALTILTFCAILAGKVLQGNPLVAVTIGMFLASATIILSYQTWQEVPNGKPRPENELKRGVVYFVTDSFRVPAINTFIVLAGYGSETLGSCTFWEFRNLPPNEMTTLKAGDKFVYLDDPKQYSRNWHQVDEGITVVLSKKGREKLLDELAQSVRYRVNS